MNSYNLRRLQGSNNKETMRKQATMGSVDLRMHLLSLCVCLMSCTGSEDNSAKGALSFHLCMGSGDKLKFVQQYLYPLS